MRWRALATDFDGTLATEGLITVETQLALLRLQEAGAKVILVTGREISDFAALDVPLKSFDLVVAENGAVLLDPQNNTARSLGSRPPEAFVAELMRRGVSPLSVGASIVATVEPYEQVAIELIREMGLEHQVIFNKGAVMILPPGVNKASGLRVALEQLRIAPADVVAVGDAENDHALLDLCGLAVAVNNAIPSLKEQAHWITEKSSGPGVIQLIDAMCSGKLDQLGRQEIL